MAIIKKSPVKKAQNGARATKDSTAYFNKEKEARFKEAKEAGKLGFRKSAEDEIKKGMVAGENAMRQKRKGMPGYDKNGYPVKKKMKAGGMIKRADGSMSKRGLWDNIRANKGSGKKPTAAMLKQEKKIKAEAKK
jgi:hypothetical protein